MLRDRNSPKASPHRHRNGFAALDRKAGGGAPCRANAKWSRRPPADRCCERDRVRPAGCKYPVLWPGFRHGGRPHTAPPATLTADCLNRFRAALRSTCGPASTTVTRAPALAKLQAINAPATPAPTIRTSLCSVKRLSRRRSPALRTSIAGARWGIQSSSSPHQGGSEASYFGQVSQPENAGIPGFEQSLLNRCATIRVWLKIG
jgi:hypothetical protein